MDIIKTALLVLASWLGTLATWAYGTSPAVAASMSLAASPPSELESTAIRVSIGVGVLTSALTVLGMIHLGLKIALAWRQYHRKDAR